MLDSLWGADFAVTAQDDKVVLNKLKKTRTVSDVRPKKVKLTLSEKLATIASDVHRILGRYESVTDVIRSREDLAQFVDDAIKSGIVAVDTETNNSLDPITCKLMGACLYTPGRNSAYVPVNHIDPDTSEKLNNQLTEQDICEELTRLNQIKIITHNGKFDYQVLKCTTGYSMNIYWDTMIGAKVLNENDRSAGLKQQYIDKIDPSVEKYSIDHLFKEVDYAVVDPDLFALYAATDSLMTYKLYLWQNEQFKLTDNSKLYILFKEVEMPIVKVASDMELTGVEIDAEYSSLLSQKYHKQLDEIDAKIDAELEKYSGTIREWRKTDSANKREYKYKSEELKKNQVYLSNPKDKSLFKKSLSEQLKTPLNTSSPTQLAIFLYDVLGVDSNDRKTDEDVLQKIDLPICKLILQRRGLLKLINTYIDKLPKCVSEKDNRLHASFNQYGTDTGRFSSSDPNLQNIPSHNKEIRLMFRASDAIIDTALEDDTAEFYTGDEVQLGDGTYKQVKLLEIGDVLLVDTDEDRSEEHQVIQILPIDDTHIKIKLE